MAKCLSISVIVILSCFFSALGFKNNIESIKNFKFRKTAAPLPRNNLNMISSLSLMGNGLSVSKFIIGLPVMYGIMSANEYFTHRYYQHNAIGNSKIYRYLRRKGMIPKIDGGGHVEHHAETYDHNMLLKTDDENWMKSPTAKRLNSDQWRGTAFTWPVTFMMLLQCIPTVYPIFTYILKWPILVTTLFYGLSMLIHGLAWNALHPAMHGLEDVPAKYGLPSSIMKPLIQSPFFEFLKDNHIGHHVTSGKANYNVCCPGFDHLVGTRMEKKEWEPMVNTSIYLQYFTIILFTSYAKHYIYDHSD